MMRRSLMPTPTASSTTYWIAGLSTIASISFGWALVAGRNRVPRPAAGTMAFFTFMVRSITGGTGSLSSPVLRAHTLGAVATISFVPTYEYACTKCGQHVEVFQRVSDE